MKEAKGRGRSTSVQHSKPRAQPGQTEQEDRGPQSNISKNKEKLMIWAGQEIIAIGFKSENN